MLCTFRGRIKKLKYEKNCKKTGEVIFQFQDTIKALESEEIFGIGFYSGKKKIIALMNGSVGKITDYRMLHFLAQNIDEDFIVEIVPKGMKKGKFYAIAKYEVKRISIDREV